MPTPILIDGTNWVHWPEPQNQNFGPWLYDGYLFIFVSEELAISGNSFCRVYKQPYNSPATPWVEVDTASHPQCNYAVAGVYYDSAAHTIYVARVDAAVTYLTSFVIGAGGTGAWGGTIASFSDAVPVDALRLYKSGSEYFVYFDYDPLGGFFSQPYWRKWSGGSWSSPVRVSTNLGSSLIVYPSQMVADDDGLLHLFWKQQPANTLAPLYGRTLDPATGTLGTVQAVTGTYRQHRVGVGVEWDSNVAVAFGWRDTSVASGISGRVYIAYGSPTTNPTWTEEAIITGIPVIQDVWTLKAGTTLYVFWCTTAALYYATKTPGGSWSSPVTWYDWSGQSYLDDDGTTLIPFDGNNFFHNGSINNVGGSIEVILGGLVDTGGSVFVSTGFYMQGPTLGGVAANRWYAI
jgi:hypothetical protein